MLSCAGELSLRRGESVRKWPESRWGCHLPSRWSPKKWVRPEGAKGAPEFGERMRRPETVTHGSWPVQPLSPIGDVNLFLIRSCLSSGEWLAGGGRVICAWIAPDLRFQWSWRCLVGPEPGREPRVPEKETGGVFRARFLKQRGTLS